VRWNVFVRFVNLLMNDTTYLMDEGLGKLSKIHMLQKELDNETHFSSLSESVQREKEKELAEMERGAESCIQLANVTVNMLSFLTESIVEPFKRPEIVERLAAMLNYNLVMLVGPKCTDLIVKNPEKYRFRPKILLSDLCQIYMNLSNENEVSESDAFVRAVATDARSYNRKHFEKAAHILVSKGVKLHNEIGPLLSFVERCERVLVQEKKQEDEMGDIPEEYLDPLMFTLMEDPVILPSSRQIIDRSTISSHLLSDSTDPFNRAPLSIDMVLPHEELRLKIKAWKEGRKSN
jgi:ubiquitin conjugation factor E4 B